MIECPRPPQVKSLRTFERCFILRRRAGLTQAQVARRIKRSTRWVTLMETGQAPVKELWEFWRE